MKNITTSITMFVFAVLFSVLSISAFAQGATLVGAVTDLVLVDGTTVNTRPHTANYNTTFLSKSVCDAKLLEIESARPEVIAVNSSAKLGYLYTMNYNSWARISTLKCVEFSQ